MPILLFLCFIVMLCCIPVDSNLTNCYFFVLVLEFVAVVFVSIHLINRTVSESSRERYISCYLLSFLISLLLLLFCWSPYLSPNNKEWGFDPQRYYVYAVELLTTGSFDGWVGSGLDGVVYFYSYLFGVFGYHPLIPLYLNMLLCLISTLAISRLFVYVDDKYFCLLMLIPEVIFYNITPGKDPNCMYGVILLLYSLCLFDSNKSLRTFVFCFFSLIFLAIFRFPYAIVLLASYGMYVFFMSENVSKSLKLLLGTSAIGGVMLLFVLIVNSGLVDLDVLNLDRRVDDIVTANIDSLEGGSALAAKLTPKSPLQVVVFGIIRSFVYLFPEMYYEFFEKPTAQNFVGLFAGLTGCILPLFIYPVFMNVFCTFRNIFDAENKVGMHQNEKILMWFFMSLFFLVAFSTPHFIHQRYRLVYDMLYVSLGIIAYYNFGQEKFFLLLKKNVYILILFAFVYLGLKVL